MADVEHSTSTHWK